VRAGLGDGTKGLGVPGKDRQKKLTQVNLYDIALRRRRFDQ
jgi:hypothetical protein